MSRNEIEKFKKIFLSNPELQDKIRTSEIVDQDTFINLIVKLGAECNCQFCVDDVKEYIVDYEANSENIAISSLWEVDPIRRYP